MVNYKKRCEDCACLVEKNGVWTCDECFGQRCEDIDDCPEGVVGDEVDEMTEKAKEITRYEQSGGRKKPARERKVDNIKLEILQELAATLEDVYKIPVDIEKEVCLHFSVDGEDYSIKLTRHRKKK